MKDSIITVRIESSLKEDVNNILKKLGLTPSQAVNLFYEQLKKEGKLPF